MNLERRDLFLSVDLPDYELGELEGITHAELLGKMFDDLTHELDVNGNTESFLRLRQDYSKKLIAFWALKRNLYSMATEQELIKPGDALQTGGERLTIQTIGDLTDGDDLSLHILRETTMEKDEVSVAIDGQRGEIDYFLRPPQIKAEIRSYPTDAPNLIYEVNFSNGFISTLTRVVYHEDPANQRPYIKDIRTIDCSIFGIDLVAEKAALEN